MEHSKKFSLNELDEAYLTEFKNVVISHLTNASSNTFEVDCEGVFATLFFNKILASPLSSNEIKYIAKTFMRKWFEGEEVCQCISSANVSKRIASFGTFLLLYYFYLPLESPTELTSILEWRENPISAPNWLQALLRPVDDPYSCLNHLLFCTLDARYLLPPADIKPPLHSHVLTSMQFLKGFKSYNSGLCKEGIAQSQSVIRSTSSQFLKAWMSFLIGLNLVRLNKFHSALLKFKDAFAADHRCLPAMYSSASVLDRMNKRDPYLKILDLLQNIELEETDRSLHAILLTLCFPLKDFSLKALYMKASSYLRHKMLKDAHEGFCCLLPKVRLEDYPFECQFCILKEEDQIPSLPPYQCIKTEYIITLMLLEKFEDGLRFAEELPGIECCKIISDEGFMEHLSSLALLTAYIIVAELEALVNIEEAIVKCTRIQRSIEWVGKTGSSLQTFFFIAKSKLFKLLHRLYHHKGQEENSKYFLQFSSFYKKDHQDFDFTNVPIEALSTLKNISAYLVAN